MYNIRATALFVASKLPSFKVAAHRRGVPSVIVSGWRFSRELTELAGAAMFSSDSMCEYE